MKCEELKIATPHPLLVGSSPWMQSFANTETAVWISFTLQEAAPLGHSYSLQFCHPRMSSLFT